MKKKFLSLFTAALMAASLLVVMPAASAGAGTSGDYEYTVLDDGTVEITDYTGSDTDITIPDEDYSVPTGSATITVTPNKTVVSPGEIITYTVSMTGSANLYGFDLDFELSHGLTYLSASNGVSTEGYVGVNSDGLLNCDCWLKDDCSFSDDTVVFNISFEVNEDAKGVIMGGIQLDDYEFYDIDFNYVEVGPSCSYTTVNVDTSRQFAWVSIPITSIRYDGIYNSYDLGIYGDGAENSSMGISMQCSGLDGAVYTDGDALQMSHASRQHYLAFDFDFDSAISGFSDIGTISFEGFSEQSYVNLTIDSITLNDLYTVIVDKSISLNYSTTASSIDADESDGIVYERTNARLVRENGIVKLYVKSYELPGDINDDNDVDIKDMSLVYKHINKTKLLTDEQVKIADVNGDSSVDIKDYSKIYKHINKTALLW